MDERNIRTERATDVEPNVDIRRSMYMGRDLDVYGTAPGTVITSGRILRWGPIFGGLVTSLVVTFLLGSLFLGFSGGHGTYNALSGLTAGNVTAGAVIATIIGVFLGGLLTGYVGELASVAEGVLNGFVVGTMAILAPLLIAAMGAWSAALAAVGAAANTLPRTANPGAAAPTVAHNVAASVPPGTSQAVSNALSVAASNAWMVFISGIIILALATLGGWAGYAWRRNSLKATYTNRAV